MVGTVMAWAGRNIYVICSRVTIALRVGPQTATGTVSSSSVLVLRLEADIVHRSDRWWRLDAKNDVGFVKIHGRVR